MERTKVINKSDIMKAIKMRGPIGWIVSTLAMSILGFNKVNRSFYRCRHLSGPEFSEAILNDIGISSDVNSAQLDYLPLEGPFITISNHHFGGADGLMLSSIVGAIRPDLKILTNFLLSMIPTLEESFLPVNPFSDSASKRKSIAGIRMAKEHLENGGCLGLFPAGEVATIQKGENRTSLKSGRVVEDIPWPSNMIKLIKNANVPVVPIYFEGENSRWFHFLGRIHPMLRTLSLANQLFKKRGKTIPMRIGWPIFPSEIADFDNLNDLGRHLRSRVYALQADFADPNKENKMEHVSPIALPRDRKAIVKELSRIKDKKLYQTAQYQCFLADYKDIPNLIHEIGRRREEAFRASGEGTNTALDIDCFDPYFKHLILWDSSKKKLAGAYRLGIGEEIFEKHSGINGFYSSSLFVYSEEFEPILRKTIELGRSFVSVQYQREALPLMLLIKGLMHSLMLYPDTEYFIGPVSISNSYPRFFQSLMFYYLNENCSSHIGLDLVSPRRPFVPDYLKTNPEYLLMGKMNTLEKFDKFLLRLSDNRYRMPTLLKKYIKINSRIICFNVDPLFNYCLDGLILLKITDFPKQELLMMTRDIENPFEREKILNRFSYSLKDKE